MLLHKDPVFLLEITTPHQHSLFLLTEGTRKSHAKSAWAALCRNLFSVLLPPVRVMLMIIFTIPQQPIQSIPFSPIPSLIINLKYFISHFLFQSLFQIDFHRSAITSSLSCRGCFFSFYFSFCEPQFHVPRLRLFKYKYIYNGPLQIAL